jgi:hypothetical protein
VTRVSRRTFVKIGGATVAGLGAASYVKPTLSTLGIPSAMAVSASPCFNPEVDPCSGQGPCGEFCACNQNVDGSVHCTLPTNCENQDCSSDADCPAGTVCQLTCCDTPKCFVLCAPGTQGAAGSYRSLGN